MDDKLKDFVENIMRLSLEIRDSCERILGMTSAPQEEEKILVKDTKNKSYKEKEDQFVADQLKRWNERGNWEYLKVSQAQMKWIENINKKRNELKDIIFKVS